MAFFEKRGHKIIPGAPLVPENDPTVLFTTAGMHPLVPYLLGLEHPLGKRLCSVQKCLRTDDIDQVGDESHLTFFEMLGNWSLGDYFKKEAIEWSHDFLSKHLSLPLERLAVSVFEGEEGIPRDEESFKIWKELGVPKERIVYLGREDNWWGPAGQTGPCGPDTEVFYWLGETAAPKHFVPKDSRWIEIWNDVFMEYNKTDEGKFAPLKQKNVDTGMGLERIAAVLQGKENVFETDLFLPVIEKIRSFTGKQNRKAERIIADHLKAATFILTEGIEPSNTERGYVLRRLIRRAVRYAKLLGIKQNFSLNIVQEVIEIYQQMYPELNQNKDFIFEQLQKEEEKFAKTLERGLKILSVKMRAAGMGAGGKITEPTPDLSERYIPPEITGEWLFNLYQTHGFPPEMVFEELKSSGCDFSNLKEKQLIKEFQEKLKKHQELSRTAAAGKFKSGLADLSKKTVSHHTATHLLQAALREVLGTRVKQIGSNITSERLRFDFSYPQKLSQEQVKKIEGLVNQKIKEDLPVQAKTMRYEEALKSGALAFFKEKYPEKVTVYSIGNFSKEICAGPHIKRTSELGYFKIIKEESSGAGVRRIKAVLETRN